jgi:hypothetical protein
MYQNLRNVIQMASLKIPRLFFNILPMFNVSQVRAYLAESYHVVYVTQVLTRLTAPGLLGLAEQVLL